MDEACVPKKAEQPIIEAAEKTRHRGCWCERLPVAAGKENEMADEMTDDAGQMRAVR